jgi:hypothetical protein
MHKFCYQKAKKEQLIKEWTRRESNDRSNNIHRIKKDHLELDRDTMKQKILKLSRRKKFGESDNNIRLDLQLSEKVDVIN